jgi:hypothetical protein
MKTKRASTAGAARRPMANLSAAAQKVTQPKRTVKPMPNVWVGRVRTDLNALFKAVLRDGFFVWGWNFARE